MNFLIIQGIHADPTSNWFPWFKKELELKGYDVVVPKFPKPLNRSLESWISVMSRYEDKINEETLVIGHSLGTAFILNYQLNKKVDVNVH